MGSKRAGQVELETKQAMKGEDPPRPSEKLRVLVEVEGRESDARGEEEAGEEVERLGGEAGKVSDDLEGRRRGSNRYSSGRVPKETHDGGGTIKRIGARSVRSQVSTRSN